ncbi:MAG: hypothetical protein ACXWNC_00505 [Anaerolineales bacterium]
MQAHRKPFILAAFITVFAFFMLAGCAPERASANPQIGAINTLRTQLEVPKLPLEFVEMTSDANSPTAMQVAVYLDTAGRKFTVNPITNMVVEMDARALMDNISPLASVLSEEQLRAKALRLIKAAIPGFESLQARLVYEEGGKIDNYFFNWYSEMPAGVFNRPHAQIAIYKTGLVFGYYNTLMFGK